MQRRLKGLAMLVATVALNGCAIGATLRSYDTTADGLEVSDARLRRLLVTAEGNKGALERAPKMPDDRLLRALYEGTLAYYAGDYSAAVKRFELAYWLTEERYTKSLSRGALSMIVSDRALEYLPGENERLFIHYYSALSYLKMGEPQEAAVEARRLVYQLQRLDEKATGRDVKTRAMLRYFAGAVFESAGETNDALVAYRNAALALGDTAGARAQTLTPGGSTVVIVEQGFVAHRVNQSIWVGLDRNETQMFVTRDDDRYRRGAYSVADRVELSLDGRDDAGLFVADAGSLRFDAPLSADSLVKELADSVASNGLFADSGSASTPVRGVPTTVVSLPPMGDATKVVQPRPSKTSKGPDAWIKEHILKGNTAASVMSETSGVEIEDDDSKKRRRGKNNILDDDYILRVSLPAFHRLRSAPLPILTVGDSSLGARVSASLSEAVVADYARQRNAVLARAIARAATRFAVTKAAEKSAEEKWGETTGEVIGFLTNRAGAVLERADTRSWHLLPERVTISRVPSGRVDSAAVLIGGVALKSAGGAMLSLRLQPVRIWY